MNFILGSLTGLLAAIGLFGFLTFWLCSRLSNIAVAKFINGIALALAHKPKSSETSAPARNGQAMAEARVTRKEGDRP